MKKILMLSFAMLMVAGLAMADDIGIFTDQIGGDNCTFNPTAPAPFDVWVVHRSPAGATGSVFKLTNNTAYALSASPASVNYLTIGGAFTDISVAYAACLAGSVPVLKVSGFAFPVPHPPCGLLTVGAAPSQAAVISVDCNFAEIPASGGRMVFNPDVTCPCVQPNATEESTWGKVKSLYR